MTQNEKIERAVRMAEKIKGVAQSLRQEAVYNDCKFPIFHAERLERIADNFLNLK